MTTLVPMRQEAFKSLFEMVVTSFAADNVAVGRWSEEESLSLSHAENERLLPQGVATPNNHLYEIQEEESGKKVGFLWFAAVTRGGTKVAFVYYVYIYPEFRRRGHARAALEAVEKIAISEGLSKIALHVFAHNPGAQALYASLGYSVAGINMLKRLQENGA